MNFVELVQKALRSVPPPVNVTLDFDSRMDEPLAELDADQLTQVLMNLVTNAYAAMPDGGALTVRVSDEGPGSDRCRLAVSDTGVGIPAENIPKLFEPFFTTKKVGQGTGLGLAVTYGIVKMHRGDISVTSNADPAKGADGHHVHRHPAPPPPGRRRGRPAPRHARDRRRALISTSGLATRSRGATRPHHAGCATVPEDPAP